MSEDTLSSTRDDLPTFVDEVKSVAVIGCGLTGGSLLLALRERAPDLRLVACDSDGETRERIRAALGIATLERPDESLRDVDVVVLATPVHVLLDQLPEVAALLDGSEAILTDVGGIKGPVHHLAQSLDVSLTFVGGHPMAGRERGGFESALPTLFDGRVTAICPLESWGDEVMDGDGRDGAPQAAAVPAPPSFVLPTTRVKSTEESIRRVESMWRLVGSRTIRCTAPDHDRAVAYVSHVPHLVAASMATVASRGGELARNLAAGGFRDTTRMAEDPTVRHAAIRNADVPSVAMEVARELRLLAARIEAGDPVDVLLNEAAAARRRIVGR